MITISSWSQRNQDEAALETLLHEVGHALVQKIITKISKAEKRQHGKLKFPDLWHAIMFYTTDHYLRTVLPGFEPYAAKYGMRDNTWEGLYPILQEFWTPYLEGRIKLNEVVDQLVIHCMKD